MKIPPKAKLVFKGTIFDTYQWEQELFNGTSATFEMLKRPNTINIIPIQDNKIIIQHEQQPGNKSCLTLPGGRQEKGETPLQSAKRELLEETGLTSNNWKLWKIYRPYDKIDWGVYVYIAKNCINTHASNPDAGEKIKLKKVSFEHFFKDIISDKFYGREFAFDILKIAYNNKLDDFKKKLFS